MMWERGSLFLLSALALIALVTPIPIAAEGEAGAKLSFSASPLKRKYSKGEDVLLALRVRNEGKQSVLLAPLSLADEYVRLRLSGPDGRDVARCSKRVDGGGLAGQRFSVVAPNASLTAVVKLSCDKPDQAGYILSRSGIYRIQAEYRVGLPRKALSELAGAALVWIGHIEAPLTEFSIADTPRAQTTKPEQEK